MDKKRIADRLQAIVEELRQIGGELEKVGVDHYRVDGPAIDLEILVDELEREEA